MYNKEAFRSTMIKSQKIALFLKTRSFFLALNTSLGSWHHNVDTYKEIIIIIIISNWKHDKQFNSYLVLH